MTDSRKEDDKMNVLMINGSPNAKGCTFTALTEIGKTLQEQNIDYEIMQLGKQPIRDCINCNRCHGEGCIFDDDMVNEFIQKAKDADGFVFGTPVYYAHPSGRLLSFLDRAFYSSASSRIYKPFQFKPAAAITGGTFIGTGSANMAQTFSSSQQGVIALSVGNQTAGTNITLKDSNENILFDFSPELPYNVVILSSPDMISGETYTVTVGTSSSSFEAK